MKLPDAIMRVWEPDTQAKIGGWIELAGGDVSEHFGVREFDHPWVGLIIEFPKFADVGFSNGTIEKCLSHPRGELMFDVRWPEPVGSIQYNVHDGYYVFDRIKGCLQRYRAHKLKDLVDDPVKRVILET